jgi:hypothetical protein
MSLMRRLRYVLSWKLSQRCDWVQFAHPLSFSACQLLEKEKLIRLIRVSNEGDIVPVAPPNLWPFLSGFTQTGLNIHVKAEEKMEVAHRNEKSFLSQSNSSALDHHGLKDYRQRLHLDDNMEVLKNNTIESLYAAHFPSS